MTNMPSPPHTPSMMYNATPDPSNHALKTSASEPRQAYHLRYPVTVQRGNWNTMTDVLQRAQCILLWVSLDTLWCSGDQHVYRSWVQWCMPVIPALSNWGHEADQEVKGILNYLVSLKAVVFIQYSGCNWSKCCPNRQFQLPVPQQHSQVGTLFPQALALSQLLKDALPKSLSLYKTQDSKAGGNPSSSGRLKSK